MKKISNHYTFIICILIILITFLSIEPHVKSENNIKSLNSIHYIQNNDITVSFDSVDYNTGHTVNSKVNDALNNTVNIKCKACDSLSLKSKNEDKTSVHRKEKTEAGEKIKRDQDILL